jgi:hypothetical protein
VQRIINAYERQKSEQQLDLQLGEKIPEAPREPRVPVEQ